MGSGGEIDRWTAGDPTRNAGSVQPVRDLIAPLRVRGFKALFFSYSINELGNWLGEIALAIVVFDATGSALASASLFVAMQFLPALLSQVLVARLELAKPRVLLSVMYFAEALLFLALAATVNHLVLPVVLLLATLDGAIAIAARSLTRAYAVQTLAPSDSVREGNALINIGFTGAAVLGPIVAGVVVASLGARAGLLIDAVSFAGAALIVIAGARTVASDRREAKHWIIELREGLQYVSRSPVLRTLLLAQGTAWIFFSLPVPIEIVYAKDTLNSGDAGYATILACWGAGMVIGSVFFAASRQRSIQFLLLLGAVANAAAYVGFAAAANLPQATGMAVIGGFGNGVVWVAMITAIQLLSPKAYTARMTALLEAVTMAVPGIGFLLGGALVAIFSTRVAFLAAGLGATFVIGVAGFRLRSLGWARRSSSTGENIAEDQNST